ncbi:MAG: hypothetical protein FWC42_06870 [Proteobacteria bacterium]|nr:hypothetical protein [Pseudomonadota bacterium]
MERWLTSEMFYQIIRIYDLISKNRFDLLEAEKSFEISRSRDIKTAILEYLGGDCQNEKDLARIGVSDIDYILKHSRLLDIYPRSPSSVDKKIEVEFIIDEANSDLTLILYAHKRDGQVEVCIYDAHTL